MTVVADDAIDSPMRLVMIAAMGLQGAQPAQTGESGWSSGLGCLGTFATQLALTGNSVIRGL